MHAKYGGKALPIILDAAGCHTRTTANTLSRLEADFTDEEEAGRTRLSVVIGAACVQADAESYAAYVEAVQRHVAASAIAGRDHRGGDAAAAPCGEPIGAGAEPAARDSIGDGETAGARAGGCTRRRGSSGGSGHDPGGGAGREPDSRGGGAASAGSGAAAVRSATQTHAGFSPSVAPAAGAARHEHAERQPARVERAGGSEEQQQRQQQRRDVRTATHTHAGFGSSVAPASAPQHSEAAWGLAAPRSIPRGRGGRQVRCVGAAGGERRLGGAWGGEPGRRAWGTVGRPSGAGAAVSERAPTQGSARCDERNC